MFVSDFILQMHVSYACLLAKHKSSTLVKIYPSILTKAQDISEIQFYVILDYFYVSIQ